MQNSERLKKLETIFLYSKNNRNKLYALRQLLQSYPKAISNDTLFKMIPYIWENTDAPTFRWRIEWEIKSRKNEDTLIRLLNLLKTENPYYWFLAAEMLVQFPDYRIVEPLIKIIEFSGNKAHEWTKLTAILALLNITTEEAAKIPLHTISNSQVKSIIENFDEYQKKIREEYSRHYPF